MVDTVWVLWQESLIKKAQGYLLLQQVFTPDGQVRLPLLLISCFMLFWVNFLLKSIRACKQSNKYKVHISKLLNHLQDSGLLRAVLTAWQTETHPRKITSSSWELRRWTESPVQFICISLTVNEGKSILEKQVKQTSSSRVVYRAQVFLTQVHKDSWTEMSS